VIDDLQKKLKFEKELNLRPTWLELGLVQVCGRYKLMVYLIHIEIFLRDQREGFHQRFLEEEGDQNDERTQ
jgi:hypothetical protein